MKNMDERSYKVEENSEDDFLMVEESDGLSQTGGSVVLEDTTKDNQERQQDEEDDEDEEECEQEAFIENVVEDEQQESVQQQQQQHQEEQEEVEKLPRQQGSVGMSKEEEDAESLLMPGASAFFTEEDQSTVSENWDSVSNFENVVKEASQAVMRHMFEADEGGNIASTLEQVFTQAVQNSFDEACDNNNNSSSNDDDAASTWSASTWTTNAPGDDPTGAILRVLQQRHVVQAVQEFISQPVVTNIVVAFAKKEEATLGAARKACMQNMGDLLAALGNLMKGAPELLQLTPLGISCLVKLFSGSTTSSSTIPEEEQEQEQEQVQQQQQQQEKKEQQRQENKPQENLVVHRHVLCDGCTNDERRQASLEAGHRQGNYIAGVRWKSAIIEDFDICSTCEATGEYEERYGPFLKITEPRKAPRELVVVLRDSAPTNQAQQQQQPRNQQQQQQQQQQRRWGFSSRSSCGAGSRSSWRNSGGSSCGSSVHSHESSSSRRSRRFQAHPAPPQPATAPTASSSAPSLKCPRFGHPLVRFLAGNGFVCDGCEKDIANRAPVHGCRACNWDLCSDCVKANGGENSESTAPSAPSAAVFANALGLGLSSLMQSSGQRPPAPIRAATTQPAANVRPQAKFVCDVTLPDGSLVQPGSEMVKTWRIQNSGSAKWPEGVRLVCVGGERMSGDVNGVAVPSLEPSATYDLGLRLVAPPHPGQRYVGYWRLMTPEPNQTRFGHRLWVDVTVASDRPSQPVSVNPPPPPPPPPLATVANPSDVERESANIQPAVVASTENDANYARFADQLTQLSDMGFTDLDANVQMLLEENGDLEKVVARLLA